MEKKTLNVVQVSWEGSGSSSWKHHVVAWSVFGTEKGLRYVDAFQISVFLWNRVDIHNHDVTGSENCMYMYTQ